MKPLEAGASREEVLAAVEEHERRARESELRFEQAEFPEVPEGFEGCVWSVDGTVKVHRGPVRQNSAVDAQDRAGEEDQTPAEWDGL